MHERGGREYCLATQSKACNNLNKKFQTKTETLTHTHKSQNTITADGTREKEMRSQGKMLLCYTL